MTATRSRGSGDFAPRLQPGSSHPPAAWVQEIDASETELRVRERIAASNGLETSHAIDARFDGAEYPVVGSRLIDTMAYARLGPRHIEGIARKSGQLAFRESAAVSQDLQTLTLTVYLRGPDGRQVENTAVFTKVITETTSHVV